jgi:transcriptional regulator with XRE-family HTH domain
MAPTRRTDADRAVLRQFGERLKQLRGDRRQDSLAGVHPVALSRYENGRVDPSLTQLVRIAGQLGLPVEDLVRGLRLPMP